MRSHPDNDQGFNVVVQRDSKANVKIATETMNISRAAKIDSASMKTIAVVTLAFLPATFVSVRSSQGRVARRSTDLSPKTVFSMSFFELSVDEQGVTQWNMSDQFWIYWVISVPLTFMTLAIWTYPQRAELLRLFYDWKDSPSNQTV